MEIKIDVKVNKSQRQILLMALAAVLIILAFWVFVYNPASNKMGKLKTQLASVQSEIDMIEKVSGRKEGLDITYKEFHERLARLEKKIPADEKSTLNILSRKANKMDIEVLVLRPEKPQKSTLIPEIQDRSVLEMPISMNIRCDLVK